MARCRCKGAKGAQQDTIHLFKPISMNNLSEKSNLKRIAGLVCTVALCTGSAYASQPITTDNFKATTAILQQNKKAAKGRVVDEQGEPLMGVNVKEVGTNNGAITDIDGNFTINLQNANSKLELSYIGFQKLTVAASSSMNVTMRSENAELNEVVVVGYGTQKKVNLTGAVATVDFTKEGSRPVTTATGALAGLTAGLQVIQGSGRPNSESFGIQIRGNGTLNNSSPLVLVDGMEQSLDDVNPNDIANISVLKDAASCAIYGNRGANGVILVTTKSGEAGRTRITYSGKFSFNSPSRLVRFVSNYADYMGFVNEASNNIGGSDIFSASTIQKWRDAEKDPNGISETGYPNYVAYPNTDWMDAIYDTKMMQEHSVSLNGNEKRTNYNISMTYLDNPGIIVNSGVKKYFLNLNVKTNVTDWLQVGAHAWGNHTDQNRNDVGNLTAWSFLKATPGIYPYYDGKYGGPEATEEDGAVGNPLLNLNGQGDSYYKYNHFYATSFAQVKFLKDFTAKTTFGYDYYQTRHKYSSMGHDSYSFSRGTYVQFAGSVADQNVYLYNNQYYNWKWTNTLAWGHTYAKKHDVSALVGFEEGKYYASNSDVNKKGIIDPSITDLSTVTNMVYISGSDTQNRFRSWFGRVNYAYDSRYLFEANARYDGSSKFAKGNRWGFFPSVSAGWRVSEEAFAKQSFLKVFQNLKVRASWGQLGNNAVGDFAYTTNYSQRYTIMNDTKVGALFMGTLPNNDITWEKTTTANIGIDFSTINDRLYGTIDFYNKNTSGILYRPDLYLTLGEKSSPYENLAEVNNKGLEITLGWRDRVGDVSYNITGNVTFNRNRVTKYKGALERGWTTDADGNKVYKSNIGEVSTGGRNRILEGHQINEYYMYHTYQGNGTYFNGDGTVNVNGGPKDGMIRTENDMKWLKAMVDAGYTFMPNRNIAKNGIWYGDYIFADTNGDGVYGDSNDQDFYGVSSDPKVNFGIQASVQWKGFDFSMNWAGAAGFKTYWREIGQNACAVVYGLQLPKEQAYDHYFYDPENPNDSRTNLTSANPRLTLNNPSQSDNLNSNLYLYDCKFIKLRNLTLGYTIPESISSKIYASNIRFYVSGENLLTITPFKGLDPEMRAGQGYTTMRQLSFGVNVSF